MFNDLYKFLKNKKIIYILDGDEEYGTYDFDDGTVVKVAMPYLRGTDFYFFEKIRCRLNK